MRGTLSGWARAALVALLSFGVAVMHAGLPASASVAAHSAMTMPAAGSPMTVTDMAAPVRPAAPNNPPQGHTGHPGGGMCLSSLPQGPATGLTGWLASGMSMLTAAPAAPGVSRRRVSAWQRCRPPPDLFALGVLRV